MTVFIAISKEIVGIPKAALFGIESLKPEIEHAEKDFGKCGRENFGRPFESVPAEWAAIRRSADSNLPMHGITDQASVEA